MKKFKIGDKVISGNNWNGGHKGYRVFGGLFTESNQEYCLLSNIYDGTDMQKTKWKVTELELYKVEVKEMKKTFKEVIADIKEGEVWVNGNITLTAQGIEIVGLNNTNKLFMVTDRLNFTLQRKKVAFTEAFKAYEEGKEIESCYTDYKYKKIDGVDQYMNDISVSWYEESEFQIDEIRGEWYINA